MSTTAKLLANSNTVWTSKKPEEPISKKSIWARNAVIVLLAVFNALAMKSCSSNASKLEQVRQENRTLSTSLNDSRKDVTDLALKNQALRHYANEAHSFLNTIVMEINDPENFEVTEETDPNVLEKAGKTLKAESKQYEAERDAALKTLGIGDEESKAVLMRLREGLQKD